MPIQDLGVELLHGTLSLTMAKVSFYFDLGSPYAYLAAERLAAILPEPVLWQPVLLGGLFAASGRSSWALTGPAQRRAGMQEVERRARDYGLGPVRWPQVWPTDYLFAMRAATHAFVRGKGEQFALQAFRDAFQRGADLSRVEAVLEVGRKVGLAPTELAQAAADPRIKAALREATEAAFVRGVTGVPTIAIEETVFWGEDRLGDAAAHLRSVRSESA